MTTCELKNGKIIVSVGTKILNFRKCTTKTARRFYSIKNETNSPWPTEVAIIKNTTPGKISYDRFLVAIDDEKITLIDLFDNMVYRFDSYDEYLGAIKFIIKMMGLNQWMEAYIALMCEDQGVNMAFKMNRPDSEKMEIIMSLFSFRHGNVPGMEGDFTSCWNWDQ